MQAKKSVLWAYTYFVNAEKVMQKDKPLVILLVYPYTCPSVYNP